MKSYKRKFAAIIYIITVFLICNIVYAQENTNLKGLYMGQKPPGLKPEILAPGVISTDLRSHSYAAFSPDGKEVYWSALRGSWKDQKIYFSKLVNNTWTKPQVAFFSGKYIDGNPVFSPDGKKLYFNSTRPVSEGAEPDKNNIWVLEKTPDGWSEPENTGIIDDTFELHNQVFVSQDGYIYFGAENKNGYGRADLYRTKFENGKWTAPENLGENINGSTHDVQPCISPDGSYLIYVSVGRPDCIGIADLYISFKQTDGTWSKSKNMGTLLNTAGPDWFPFITRDGKYFIFASSREGGDNVYWVDAKIINEIK